jgi:hypothetical protein
MLLKYPRQASKCTSHYPARFRAASTTALFSLNLILLSQSRHHPAALGVAAASIRSEKATRATRPGDGHVQVADVLVEVGAATLAIATSTAPSVRREETVDPGRNRVRSVVANLLHLFSVSAPDPGSPPPSNIMPCQRARRRV